MRRSRPRPARRRPRRPASAPRHGHVPPRRRRAWRGATTCRIEVLHPDRGALAERVDGIVIVHRRVAEDGAPEARSIASGWAATASWTSWTAPRSAVAPCSRATAEMALATSTWRASVPHISACELHGEAVGGRGQQRAFSRPAPPPPRPPAPLPGEASPRGTRPSDRRGGPPSRRRHRRRGSRATLVRSCRSG